MAVIYQDFAVGGKINERDGMRARAYISFTCFSYPTKHKQISNGIRAMTAIR